MFDSVEVRVAYCEEMIKLAKADERIVLVEADLCRAAGMMKFKEEFPERTFDVGVAEANMTGIAAGLAAMGKRPFIHTFAPFMTHRALDQIVVSIAYANLPVKIIGSDPGFSAEVNGGTHMSFDDIGIMRAIPDMTVFEPCDEASMRALLPQMHASDKPCYMRLFRKKAETVYTSPDAHDFKIGKCNMLKSGSDVLVITYGAVTIDCLKAAAALDGDGISAAVADMHTIKPLDLDFLADNIGKYKAVVTVENHSVMNGLGSAVSEYIAESGQAVKFKRIGVQDRFGEVGFRPYLQQALGLDADSIAEGIKCLVK